MAGPFKVINQLGRWAITHLSLRRDGHLAKRRVFLAASRAVRFPDEAALHSLVEQEPQILPLAGSPNLVIVGREVRLGNGYADLIAIEPAGRLAIIEIKLARNAEARRAVIAQVLAYAAFLYGSTVEDLENLTLRNHLSERGYSSLDDAVQKRDQEGIYADSDFSSSLAHNLAEGRFRLVFVLDSAPIELVDLAAFLGAISDKLLIDLVSISSFDVNGSQIVVPQRISPEGKEASVQPHTPERSPSSRTFRTTGSSDFRKSFEEAPVEVRPVLTRLTEWADSIEAKGLAKLMTTAVRDGLSWSLLAYVSIENAGLITIYNWRGKPSLAFWRSVFERRAPNSVERVERCLSPVLLGQGNEIEGGAVTDELLDALMAAYEEAAQASR